MIDFTGSISFFVKGRNIMIPKSLWEEAINAFKNYSGSETDSHISTLQFVNNFRCEKHVDTPTYWDCKRCDYFYKDGLGCSRCLKRDIQDWVMFREEKN